VYVPKAKLTPAEAIGLVHEAGGVAVMAHPALTDRDNMIA
jgi:predicted metal-dependent phosphoesterase TrpH